MGVLAAEHRREKYTVPANTMVIAGDSLTAYYGVDESERIWHLGSSFWLQVVTQLSGRLNIVQNSGVSGNTVAQLAARFDSDVLAWRNRANFLGLCIGVNTTLDDQAECDLEVANVISMIKRATQIGYVTVLIAQPLKSNLSATQQSYHNQFNHRLADYAEKTNDVIYINPWHSVVEAGTAADYEAGNWDTGYMGTNPHPNTEGAIRVAGEIVKVLDSVLPKHFNLPDAMWYTGGQRGDYDNAVKNGGMFGVAGTAGTGASGDIADLWTIERLNGAGITATCSKVARTDGQPSSWQRIALAAAGADTDIIEMTQTIDLSGTEIAVGDTVFVMVEIASSASSGYLSRVEALVEQIDGSAAVKHHVSHGYPGGYTNTNPRTNYVSSDNDCSITGIIRTMPFVIRATTETMRFNIRCGTSTGGAGTVDVGRVMLRKVYSD